MSEFDHVVFILIFSDVATLSTEIKTFINAKRKLRNNPENKIRTSERRFKTDLSAGLTLKFYSSFRVKYIECFQIVHIQIKIKKNNASCQQNSMLQNMRFFNKGNCS